jgi:hypothetical protein
MAWWDINGPQLSLDSMYTISYQLVNVRFYVWNYIVVLIEKHCIIRKGTDKGVSGWAIRKQ